MKFSIPNRPKSLCETCTSLVRTVDGNGIVVQHVCTAVHGRPRPVPEVISECNQYSFQYREAPFEMRSIAWVLERNRTRIIGFKSPEERREERRKNGGFVDDDD